MPPPGPRSPVGDLGVLGCWVLVETDGNRDKDHSEVSPAVSSHCMGMAWRERQPLFTPALGTHRWGKRVSPRAQAPPRPLNPGFWV